jgi:glycosyltransferase involved in cell wall biosynthesis
MQEQKQSVISGDTTCPSQNDATRPLEASSKASAKLSPSRRLADRNESRKSSWSSRLTLSAIIPTKNRPEELLIVVRGLLAQSIPPCQIIIVDQSDTDEGRMLVERELGKAPEFIRNSLKLNYVCDTSITGGAVARNRAMELARSDVWLFLDDDVELEGDFVEQLLRVYTTDPDIGGVSGVITNYAPPTWSFKLWTCPSTMNANPSIGIATDCEKRIRSRFASLAAV